MFRSPIASSRSALVLGALSLGLAASVSAQQVFSTGQNALGGFDQHWSVTYDNGSTTNVPNAAVVTNPPSVWQTGTNGVWISPVASASVGGATSYTYQTVFSLAGYDPNTVSISFRCAVDNMFTGYSINGGALVTSGCGSQATGYQVGATQTINSGFTSGLNTLVFKSTGDGTTDALLVSIDNVSGRGTTTTPEPSSMALLGTGLVGLVPMVRRRRK